jgi:hypothetical protein
VVARRAHNPKVGGSSPPLATNGNLFDRANKARKSKQKNLWCVKIEKTYTILLIADRSDHFSTLFSRVLK